MCRVIVLNTRKSKAFFLGWIVMISSTTHNQSRKETTVKAYGLPTAAIQIAKASHNFLNK